MARFENEFDTMDWNEEDYNNFLDYLEDIDDLEGDPDCDEEDDDDMNEVEVYDRHSSYLSKERDVYNEVKRRTLTEFKNDLFSASLTEDNNERNLNIDANGNKFSISVNSIGKLINDINNGIIRAQNRSLKRKVDRLKYRR